jgi:hypothetical protein
MRRLRDLALIAAGALAAAAGAHAAGVAPFAAKSVTPVAVSVRPTGVGLPVVGSKPYAAAGLPAVARRYHDSGAYARDIATVDKIAKGYLKDRLAKGSRPRRKPALVLDIDETSLSNYAAIAASSFTGSGTADIVAGTGTKIAPTLSLARYARRRGVALFFITGRPPQIRAVTETNLKAAGYAGWKKLYMKPATANTRTFKAGSRAAIERAGYRILVNVGDQESDLSGGRAAAAFKLPNPFYFVP